MEIILNGFHAGKKDSHSHGMVVFPSEVTLLLVSHSSCLWVRIRIRKQLTYYVGCDRYCYNGCPSSCTTLYPSPHSDWWEQSKKSDWIVMLKIKHSLFLFSGGYEIAGVRIPSFAISVLQCGQNQRIPSCGNSAGSVVITRELAHLWQLCCSCEHNQRKFHLWQSCHNVNIIRVSHHLWQ